MCKPIRKGIYTDLIGQYIAYKRSLGFKMIGIEDILNRLNNMKATPTELQSGISKALFDEWSIPRPEEVDSNRYLRIFILRQFSFYLQMVGFDSYISRLPSSKRTFVPHIFTKNEVASIFVASDKLFLKVINMNSALYIMPTLLRLLYSTGIRIGEALNIKHKDVVLDKEYLVLRACKNGQDRVVTISNSMAVVCKDYCIYKQKQLIDTSPGAYFFTSLNGAKSNRGLVSCHFRTGLYKAGIPYKGRGKGPRVHDLRHTFCVKSLSKMTETGIDIYNALPILSTYIGHQSINATNMYIRLTAEMYPSILNKVDASYKHVFPELETLEYDAAY
jgi:integrase/recombinase XerD